MKPNPSVKDTSCTGRKPPLASNNREWHMLSGGTTFVGDKWLFIGPIELPFQVPSDRIRLNAFGRQVYLWRLVAAIATAARSRGQVLHLALEFLRSGWGLRKMQDLTPASMTPASMRAVR